MNKQYMKKYKKKIPSMIGSKPAVPILVGAPSPPPIISSIFESTCSDVFNASIVSAQASASSPPKLRLVNSKTPASTSAK